MSSREATPSHSARPRLWRLMSYAILALWSLVCIFPVYWLVNVSIMPTSAVDTGPHFLPVFGFSPSLRAWRFILADPFESLLRPLLNSAVVATAATLLTLACSALALYALTRLRLPVLRLPTGRGRPVSPMLGLLPAVLATRVVPPVVLALPIYVMAARSGTLDTRFILIMTYAAANLPVSMWLLRPVLGLRPTDQEESAQLDGASHLRILVSVLLPMVAGGVAATGLLIFMLCWNEYLFAAYLATDHAATLPTWAAGQLSMKEAQAASEGEEWANLSAATILMALPLLGFAAVLQRILGQSVSRH